MFFNCFYGYNCKMFNLFVGEAEGKELLRFGFIYHRINRINRIGLHFIIPDTVVPPYGAGGLNGSRLGQV